MAERLRDVEISSKHFSTQEKLKVGSCVNRLLSETDIESCCLVWCGRKNFVVRKRTAGEVNFLGSIETFLINAVARSDWPVTTSRRQRILCYGRGKKLLATD